MTTIANIQTDHYLIKLPVTLSDSTHGQMTHFELVTVRIRDKDGAEGSGYTFTVGTNGAAVHATVKRDLAPRLDGRAGRSHRSAVEEDVVGTALRRPWRHGGDGHLRGRHRAVGSQGAQVRRAAVDPAGRRRPEGALLRRRHRPVLPARQAAGTDRRQSEEGVPRHQDESGPPQAVGGRGARAGHARASRRATSR